MHLYQYLSHHPMRILRSPKDFPVPLSLTLCNTFATASITTFFMFIFRVIVLLLDHKLKKSRNCSMSLYHHRIAVTWLLENKNNLGNIFKKTILSAMTYFLCLVPAVLPSFQWFSLCNSIRPSLFIHWVGGLWSLDMTPLTTSGTL